MMIQLVGGGWLRVEEDGGYVRCAVTRPNDGRGIYKVWLNGMGEGLLLGTLVPEGDELRLCRRVSRDSLVRAGCWPVEGGRCVLAVSFGAAGGAVREMLEGRMSDPILRQAARGLWALVWGEEDSFSVKLPFDTARPFPLVPAFCFAKVERMEGQLWAVFSFDGKGSPKMQE